LEPGKGDGGMKKNDISSAAKKRARVLCLVLGALILYGAGAYYLSIRLDKKAIEKRTRRVNRRDRYHRLPPERQKTVDELILNRNNPEVLKSIYIEAVKNDGVKEEEAKRFTNVLMCTAFAETLAQYLGNRIPPYAGDAWTIYRKNPAFRLYQIYPESIDRYGMASLKKGGGPSIPPLSNENPPLVTGDIVTMPLGTSKYVYHSGVVLTDTKSVPPLQYFIESRGEIHLDEIAGGNIRFLMGEKNFKEFPITEVIGDL